MALWPVVEEAHLGRAAERRGMSPFSPVTGPSARLASALAVTERSGSRARRHRAGELHGRLHSRLAVGILRPEGTVRVAAEHHEAGDVGTVSPS